MLHRRSAAPGDGKFNQNPTYIMRVTGRRAGRVWMWWWINWDQGWPMQRFALCGKTFQNAVYNSRSWVFASLVGAMRRPCTWMASRRLRRFTTCQSSVEGVKEELTSREFPVPRSCDFFCRKGEKPRLQTFPSETAYSLTAAPVATRFSGSVSVNNSTVPGFSVACG